MRYEPNDGTRHSVFTQLFTQYVPKHDRIKVWSPSYDLITHWVPNKDTGVEQNHHDAAVNYFDRIRDDREPLPDDRSGGDLIIAGTETYDAADGYVWVWIMCDPEGNGPGHLNIEDEE